jgi:PhnB protein
MHSTLTTKGGMVLMASDTPNQMDYTPGNNCSLSLSGEAEGELRGYWEKRSVGGSVTVPLDHAPWGDTFGMCTDRFGINWLVDIVAPGTPGGAPGS